MAGERLLTITQSSQRQGSQNGEQEQGPHGLSGVLSGLVRQQGEEGSCRLSVKDCGVFIRTRAAEKGGASGREPGRWGPVGLYQHWDFSQIFLPSRYCVLWVGSSLSLLDLTMLQQDAALVQKLRPPYVWGRTWARSTEKGVTANMCSPLWSTLLARTVGLSGLALRQSCSVLPAPLMDGQEVLARKDFTCLQVLIPTSFPSQAERSVLDQAGICLAMGTFAFFQVLHRVEMPSGPIGFCFLNWLHCHLTIQFCDVSPNLCPNALLGWISLTQNAAGIRVPISYFLKALSW